LVRPSSRRRAMDMSVKLTENQTALLQNAARREDRCFVLPPNLKGGTAQKVAAKLIAEGLAKEIKAKAGAPIWRTDAKSEQTYSLKLSRRQGDRSQRSAKWKARACLSRRRAFPKLEGFVGGFPSRGARKQSGAARG
jgi:hypothetical protein